MRDVRLVFRILWSVCAACLALSVGAEQDRLMVSDFSLGALGEWNEKVFHNRTHYSLVNDDTGSVLKAESRQSASGLFKKVRIDLHQYPYINWRWKITNQLQTGDETTKQGDDYAARLYVLVDGGWMLWRTRALNYVWASRAEKGAVWPNAFAGKNAMMLAVRNSHDKTGTWYQEKRNLLKDMQALHGEGIRYIDAIAVMTDSDNSGGEVTAFYDDVFFSAQ